MAEMGKLFEFSTVPAYLYVVFLGQFFMLNYIADATDFHVKCGPDRYDLTKIWVILELRVFYGWLLTGVLFLTIAQIKPITKSYLDTEISQGPISLMPRSKEKSQSKDYMEKNKIAVVDFQLSSFELLVTFITFVGERLNHEAYYTLD